MRLFSSKILLKGNPKQWDYAVENDELKTMKCTDLIYDSTQFVALGYGEYSLWLEFSTSSNGKTWASKTRKQNLTASSWCGVARNSTKYCFIGNDSYGGIYSTTTSISSWDSPTSSRFATDLKALSICVNNENKFVVLFENGRISTSSDGETWSIPYKDFNPSSVTGFIPNTIFYDGVSKLIIVGHSGYAYKENSSDIWTLRALGDVNWSCIDYINGTYYVYATTGEVTTSTDLENWTEPQKLPYLTNGGWVATAHSSSVQVLLNNEGYISTKQI